MTERDHGIDFRGPERRDNAGGERGGPEQSDNQKVGEDICHADAVKHRA